MSRRLFCPHCGAQLLGQPCNTCGLFCSDEHHHKADPAVWVDGPDSEARRAARTPDPTHTPAVRRVVAWEAVGGDLTESRHAAYSQAALSRMTVVGTNAPSRRRLHIRMHEMDADWEYFGRVLDRLSAYLRRRDERAGYR